MDKKPLVSVIIPTYKDHEGLNKALKSVVNQTYENLEIIVVNDYPEEDIENYIEIEDDRIKTIDVEYNRGGAGEGARNIGIENSNGKYLTFLDGDDELKPDTIEKQINKLKEKQGKDSEYKAVTVWGEARDPNGKKRTIKYPEKEGNIFKETLTHNNIVPPGPLLEKKILEETGKYDEDVRIGDWDLCIRIAKKYKIAVVKEPLYIYYPKTAEEMQGIYSWRYKSHKKMLEKYWEDIK
ncbi:MAG: glycosyltransferase family 2 protein, partial [archaeon]